jgi:hypothetical protein
MVLHLVKPLRGISKANSEVDTIGEINGQSISPTYIPPKFHRGESSMLFP